MQLGPLRHERFAHRRPWLDVMSKSKLVPALGGELCPDLEGLWRGLYKSNAVCPIASKAPGFNPCAYKVCVSV
jgi:hypothetical protein